MIAILKVIIVDDEKYIRDELKYFLSKYEDVEICGETGQGEEAMDLVETLAPDIVFLDIHLQDMSGLLLARKILDMKNPPYVILATAYDEYAIQGYEIDVSDYLLKPFSEERIKKTIDRIRKKKGSQEIVKRQQNDKTVDKLCVVKGNRILLIDIKDIIYIESQNNELIVYTVSENYKCSYSLKELEDKLSVSKFIRTHKCFIVNIDYIDEIIPWFNYTYKVKIKGRENIEVQVSRNYLKKFKSMLGI